MKTSNICCILNYPPHYREQIYRLMEKELDCDFYFGNIEKGRIRPINYSHFSKPIKDLTTTRLPFGFNWIGGAVSLIFQPYRKFILVGEPYCLSTWLCLISARILGKQAYLWTHGWYGGESRIKTLVKKAFYNLSTGLFLYGNYAKKLMLKEGFKNERMNVVYNSLDYDLQKKIRTDLRYTSIYQNYFGNKDPVLIFTGRLTPVKKLDQLIDAHKVLSSQKIHFNVVILGDGTEEENLQSQSSKAGLSSRYWFYGPCYDEAVIGELYYNAAVCISPGNVGLTAIHSLMYGCPVITHSDFTQQMPEFEAIQMGTTGSFFEYGNVGSLAKAIEVWLNKHYPKDEFLKNDCFKVIDERFNPYYQMKILKQLL